MVESISINSQNNLFCNQPVRIRKLQHGTPGILKGCFYSLEHLNFQDKSRMNIFIIQNNSAT